MPSSPVVTRTACVSFLLTGRSPCCCSAFFIAVSVERAARMVCLNNNYCCFSSLMRLSNLRRLPCFKFFLPPLDEIRRTYFHRVAMMTTTATTTTRNTTSHVHIDMCRRKEHAYTISPPKTVYLSKGDYICCIPYFVSHMSDLLDVIPSTAASGHSSCNGEVSSRAISRSISLYLGRVHIKIK